MAFLWDVSTGNVIRRLVTHTQRINTVAMNADASVLFTGSYDATVCVWDLRSGSRGSHLIIRSTHPFVSSSHLFTSTLLSLKRFIITNTFPTHLSLLFTFFFLS